MVAPVYPYSKPNPPPGTYLDARVATPTGGIAMSGSLRLKLKPLATAEEIAALKVAMENATFERDRIGWVCANSMEKFFDLHGKPGLRSQIIHMMMHLGKWHGEEARTCKVILRNFSKSK